MKYFIAKYTTPAAVDAVSPVNLLRLADSMGENTSCSLPPIGDDINNGELPRNINDIMTDVRNKKFENITLIEWIYCFFNKIKWDQENSSLEWSSADLVWQGALKNKPAKYRLFWLLAIAYINPDKSLLSPSIVRAFNDSNNFKGKVLDDIVTIKILRYLKTKNSYNSIADLCFSSHKNPEKLLSSNNLPWNIKIGEEYTLAEAISLKLPEAFSRSKEQKETDFSILFDNLTSIRGKYQVEFVENILKYIPPEKGSQFTQLADWLKKHYGIASEGWNQLSHDAKIAIRKWIGAINFKDFENLVDAIITVISLENKEQDQIKKQQNQIKRRQYFWSNYTYQFERIRILLPMKTSNTLKAMNYNLEGVDLLKEDGSDDSEVCIFEFSPYIIVEFFRGRGSETIIFDPRKNYFYKNRIIDLTRTLFEGQLSIKQIRSIDVSSESIHDHAYYWQNSCEQLLRGKGIYPNPDLKFFLIGESVQDKKIYNRLTGLPPMDSDAINKREDGLQKWSKTMERIRIEALSQDDHNFIFFEFEDD